MNEEKNTAPAFVPGLELAEGFYRDAVVPVLESHFPTLPHSAALIGPGSEVLGYDTEMSTDHHWGPRVMIFLSPADCSRHRHAVHNVLADALPTTYRGYPTHFSEPNPDDNGVQLLQRVDSGPINHRVEILTIEGFFAEYMDIDIAADLSSEDWLTLPHQKLRSVCAGAVFRDDLGLDRVRERLAWYPHDVWLYVLASCWSRIGEEEHLTGRAGMAGDEIGSALVASRLVRDIMRLGFLMERAYPPYPKWFGTAFRELRCAESLTPVLSAILKAPGWRERDPLLGEAYRIIAHLHNRRGLTEPVPDNPSPFHGRPFTVIHGERFASALTSRIEDPSVKAIAAQRLIGSIDLFSDSTDLVEGQSRRRTVGLLYRGGDSRA